MNIKKNLSIPVIAAPMFLISGPKLVTACCKNGIIGTFPALNQKSTEGFDAWLNEIETDLTNFEKGAERPPAPFGVNLIVHRSNPRLEADLEVVVKHKVPIVITSLGAVSRLIDAVHSYGGLVFHDVINRRHAEKAIEAGVDGLILVCAGAGGHAGTLNPMAFVNEIRSFYDGMILLSGAMSTGKDVAAAMQMGADFAYMGTRFINTSEASSDKNYQDMIIKSGTTDIVYTAAVSGVNANFLRISLEEAGITKDLWDKKVKIDFGKELDATKAESKAWKTIWSAGHGVASINDVLSVKELATRLRSEFLEAVIEQGRLLGEY